MDIPSLPGALQQLRDRLTALDFEVADTDYDPEHFGDTVVLLTGRDLQVRLIRDRGQWFVMVGAVAFEEWFSPMVWRAYFDRDTGPTATPNLEEQAQMILDDLVNMRDAVLDDADLLEHLCSYRLARYESKPTSA